MSLNTQRKEKIYNVYNYDFATTIREEIAKPGLTLDNIENKLSERLERDLQGVKNSEQATGWQGQLARFIENNKMTKFMMSNFIYLTAAGWMSGDFLRVLATAFATSISSPKQPVSYDEKFTIIMKSINDGLVNILVYWLPYFLILPVAKGSIKKVMGPQVNERVKNFIAEATVLFPVVGMHYGIGSSLSANMTQWLISNKFKKPWINNNPGMSWLMSLSDDSDTLRQAKQKAQQEESARYSLTH